MKDRIAATCRALALDATAEQVAALAEFAALLLRWNAVYNLSAIRDPDTVLTHHLADCLAVVAPLRRALPSGRILDVGSGGGLPGVVLAVMNPGWDVSCCDAVAKKAAFVNQAAGALRLHNLRGVHARVETLTAERFDLVTSRAFASLADFVRLTERSLADGGCWVAMKGKRPQEEIAALPPSVDVFHVEPLDVPGLAAERCLVWMRRQAAETALPS